MTHLKERETETENGYSLQFYESIKGLHVILQLCIVYLDYNLSKTNSYLFTVQNTSHTFETIQITINQIGHYPFKRVNIPFVPI